LREGRAGLAPLFRPTKLLWASGACWALMFTAFMIALTLTSVAHVLVVMSLGPLFTALLAWLVLGQRLTLTAMACVAIAGCGVAWMFSGDGFSLGWGLLVAVVVPIAAASNWILLQSQAKTGQAHQPGLAHAVALGAFISAAVTLPFAWPLQASGSDLAWLGFLGATQLALPCVLLVYLTKFLSATEISLLALLELLFGIAWVWWLAAEAPSPHTLGGGALVLVALVLNEVRRPPAAICT
jgi:drug/metabolite transporter (DMT)-like permease